jgi:two-component system chemotaxis sensor kinase CheA
VDPSRYAGLFLADSRDHLGRAGALLLEWERAPGTGEPVAEVFRAFHSVKGAAAAMGYGAVADLAHAAEHLLEAVRRGELVPSRPVIGLLLRAVDVLEQGVEAAVSGGEVPEASPLTEALQRMAESGLPAGAVSGEPPPEPRPRAAAPAVPKRRPSRSVRIEPSRLDELLQLAGELVVAASRLDAVVQPGSSPELEAATSQVGSLVRAMHGTVLRARLAPISELFERFPRVVRDLGESLGRAVRLELKADGIELDRGMLEELVDPLVHLVRNAVDHGIEPGAERLRVGKPAEGRLVLGAERRRDWVRLFLSDDGRGIDRSQVAERASAERLRPAGAPLPDDAELLALLARPGFTLKGRVTEVSGRGVGMDVVVSTVRSLGGRVDLTTQVGVGSTFALTVPLTTAIQRVLLVGVAGERFALPFRVVREATRAPAASIAAASSGSRFSFRSQSLPLIDLAGPVGRPTGGEEGDQRPVLMLEWGARQGALAVDEVLGQMDVLIERLEAPVGLPAWISGATILGDGTPAFVLDPTALF